jgi:hypothetical protein
VIANDIEKSSARIGLDFDNTIIDYDDVFYDYALRKGLIEKNNLRDKNSIRSVVRGKDNGELIWQSLQAEVYGTGLKFAKLQIGVNEFLDRGCRRGVQFYIVSHKSQYATQDVGKHHNLVEGALGWLKSNRIVSKDGPIYEKNVFFEPSREQKIRRIGSLGCGIFIDDLEEVFLDECFPKDVVPVLYKKHGLPARIFENTYKSWLEIERTYFS